VVADPSLITRRGLIGTACALPALPALWAAAARSTEALDEFVVARMRDGTIPGLALVITRGGRSIVTRAYGLADIAARRPVRTHAMFHIASVTKTVMALAIMRLVDRRRIAIDEPVARHLDFQVAGPGASAITFRHLLMHTSGISDETYYHVDFRIRGRDATTPLAELLKAYLVDGGRYYRSGNVKSAPGAAWDYSNIGYALLGYAASRIVGGDLREMLARDLFEPMGLRHTAWTIAATPTRARVTPYELTDGVVTEVEPVGFPDWPAGMIRASASDLARLVAVAANDGVVDGKRVLSAGSAAAMLEMQRPAGLPDWLSGQGLGWQQSLLAGVPRANHWGGDPGVFAMAYVDPARRVGVVLLSNLSATANSRQAMKAIADRAFAVSALPDA